MSAAAADCAAASASAAADGAAGDKHEELRVGVEPVWQRACATVTGRHILHLAFFCCVVVLIWMVLDIADAYSGAASAAAGVGLAPLFALESETRLLGLALSVPVLALLLLVSLRMELRGRSAGLKLQDAHAAWALAELPSPVQALSRGVRYLAAVVMRAGPVPRHVAFIMDGNRRWAKQLGVKTLNGHTAGYEAMCGILEHCKDLGVEVVTVYAFSIENFKRDQAEVDYIMDLAMRKFEDAVSETGDLFKHKVRVRVLGDLTLLPRSVREASARITFATAKNTGPICNICLSYTSRQEIAATVRSVVEGVREGVLEADDCDVALLSRAMYTADLPTPELLVRTSGETRLSDFMLWQCASAHLAFTPVLWPSFSWWQLMKILLDYQRHYPALAARRAHHEQLQASTDLQRQLVVLQAEKEEEEASGAAGGAKRRRKQQQQQRQQQRIVEEEEGKDGLAGQETQQIEAAGSVAKRQLQRQERVEGFLQKLAETRQTSLKALLLQEVEKQSRVQ